MKKLILTMALCFSFGIITISCKGEKKEATEHSETHENHAADRADIAMNEAYQCPMDCEEGKTYDKEGKCPVCKMDLKKVEKEVESKKEEKTGHEGHNHD